MSACLAGRLDRGVFPIKGRALPLFPSNICTDPLLILNLKLRVIFILSLVKTHIVENFMVISCKIVRYSYWLVFFSNFGNFGKGRKCVVP